MSEALYWVCCLLNVWGMGGGDQAAVKQKHPFISCRAQAAEGCTMHHGFCREVHPELHRGFCREVNQEAGGISLPPGRAGERLCSRRLLAGRGGISTRGQVGSPLSFKSL